MIVYVKSVAFIVFDKSIRSDGLLSALATFDWIMPFCWSSFSMPKAPESVPAKTRTNNNASSKPLAVHLRQFFTRFCPLFLAFSICHSPYMRPRCIDFIYFIIYIHSNQSFYWTICKINSFSHFRKVSLDSFSPNGLP